MAAGIRSTWEKQSSGASVKNISAMGELIPLERNTFVAQILTYNFKLCMVIEYTIPKHLYYPTSLRLYNLYKP